MKFLFARRNGALIAFLCLIATMGCTPPPGSGTVTPIERYIESGKSRAERNDFDGALVAFEKAFSIDMNNATVHYQLGVLFDEDLNQPEKSLYHFTRVLELDPDYHWSDMIENSLPRLRMRVSSGSIPMVQSAELEKEIVKLYNDLALKNKELQKQANINIELRQRIRSIVGNSGQVQPNRQPVPPKTTATPPGSRSTRPSTTVRNTPPPADPKPKLRYTPPTQIRYKVLRKDTLYSLGKRYRVSPSDIMRANPGLTARTLRIGRVIIIPNQ